MEMSSDGNGAGAVSPPITDLSDYQQLEKNLRSMSEDQQPHCCPRLFERAGKSWWNPRFDSDILEGQYWRSTFPRTTRRFQLGLTYLLILCSVWAVYFPAIGSPHWYIFLTASLSIGVIVCLMFILVSSSIFVDNYFKVSLIFSILLCSTSLCVYLQLTPEHDQVVTAGHHGTNVSHVPVRSGSDLSDAGLFALYVQVLVLIYTVIPLPLYGTLIVGLMYTCLLEIFAGVIYNSRDVFTVLVRFLIHICLHILGSHILLMTNVRMRDTFMKVGQSLLVKRQLVMEKQLKEKMIHSVMPPKVADWLMKGGIDDDDDDVDIDSETGSMMRKISSPRSSNQGDIRTIFRPFNMNAMENVSILFADIVGFTKMSSNKSATQLVGLLNDLFGRFDRLCSLCNCEKISTLGDCYYCVSGCPEPREDHANNCVKMGLSMIRAIKDFDKDCKEDINMRVGIHTGTVLCGIVGRKRFKFDVWSNDVTLANRMESTGRPGAVHISEKTYAFLKEDYSVEDGETFLGMRTYFITGQKNSSISSHLLRSSQNGDHKHSNNNFAASDINGTKSLPSLAGEMSEGKVIINKLQRFLRQRSVPTPSETSQTSPVLQAVRDDDNDNLGEEDASDVDNNHNSASLSSLKIENGPKLDDDLINVKKTNKKFSSSGSCSPAPAPLVSMDSEFDIMSGHETPDTLDHDRLPTPDLLSNDVKSQSYSTKTKTSVSSNDLGLNLKFQSYDVSSNGVSSARITDSLRFYQLRKQSDLVLIRSVQEDTAHTKYFTKPPLHFLSCFFLDPTIESEYRGTAWRANQSYLSDFQPESTLAASSFNAYIDILLSGIVFLLVSIASYVNFSASTAWIAVSALAGVYYVLVIIVTVSFSSPPRSFIRKIYNWGRRWYPTQIFGALLITLPIISLFSNLTIENLDIMEDGRRDFFMNLLVVTLIYFCNFTQIYCYVKSLLATIFAFGLLVFMYMTSSKEHVQCTNIRQNITSELDEDLCSSVSTSSSYSNYFLEELVLVIITIIVLIWMLNREFEINYRLSYHCSLLAARDRKKILNLKNQADWLLHNIIPSHVSDQLKKSAKYSENHKDIGIVFATLVNFNELYDESYMGGKEFLRVLNELISDFDDLLDKTEFRNVEKIKTIGATFMAASGLNPNIREENHHKYQHLRELMDFAYSLQNSVEDFNQSLIEFDLVLRIGFNYGDITSGVIGTTKLYYDIWGDAVNIASRMDSCGVDGRIQVNERTRCVLSEWFEFEERGEVFVKGKDNMKVFLAVGKKYFDTS